MYGETVFQPHFPEISNTDLMQSVEKIKLEISSWAQFDEALSSTILSALITVQNYNS